jgi:PII-like signaling protein
MLTQGRARKVTIFLNEDVRHHHTALHDAVMTFLLHKGIAGATATRALSGFGSHQQLHTPHIEVIAEHLPIRIEFIESPEKVDEVLPMLYEMVADGLIEVQDTTVIKLSRRAASAAESAGAVAPHHRVQGPAKLLRVYLGEDDKWHGEPLYDAIVRKLRMMEIAGATVFRGVMGYGAKGEPHKRTFLHPMRDLPVMISVVDTPEKIATAVEAIEGMLDDGLIVLSDVEMIRLVRDIRP